MNISEIKQLPNVDGWIDCNAQIKEVKEIKQRTKSNLSKTPGQKYNVQKLIIQDNTDIISLWAYATQQFVPDQNIEVHGMVKEYQGKRYLDYCDIKTNTNTYQAPQNSPQAPPQPAQPTNSPQPTPQQDDASKIVRDNVVCSFIQSGELKLDDLSIDVATAINKWVKFILTNISPNQSENSPTKDLFCEGCNNLKEECTCNQPEGQRQVTDADVPF